VRRSRALGRMRLTWDVGTQGAQPKPGSTACIGQTETATGLSGLDHEPLLSRGSLLRIENP
jgi:hypothetical protein